MSIKHKRKPPAAPARPTSPAMPAVLPRIISETSRRPELDPEEVAKILEPGPKAPARPEEGLTVKLGIDHDSLVLVLDSGREVTLMNSEKGMANLVEYLRIQHRKIAGKPAATPPRLPGPLILADYSRDGLAEGEGKLPKHRAIRLHELQAKGLTLNQAIEEYKLELRMERAAKARESAKARAVAQGKIPTATSLEDLGL